MKEWENHQSSRTISNNRQEEENGKDHFLLDQHKTNDEEDDHRRELGKDVNEKCSLEKKVVNGPNLLEEVIPIIVNSRDLEKDAPISPLDDDIGYYLHIEEGKWEIEGHPYDKDPLYDNDKEDEVKVSLPFFQHITFDDTTIDHLEREGDHNTCKFFLGRHCSLL